MDNSLNYSRILDNIAACQDVNKLAAFISNAKRHKVAIVEEAAVKQLKSLIPPYENGTYEAAFWDMITAYHAILLENGKPTTKLIQSWKQALNECVLQAHKDWIANRNQAWALNYFLANSPQMMTAESLVLHYSDLFDLETQSVAKQTLDIAKSKLLEMA